MALEIFDVAGWLHFFKGFRGMMIMFLLSSQEIWKGIIKKLGEYQLRSLSMPFLKFQGFEEGECGGLAIRKVS